MLEDLRQYTSLGTIGFYWELLNLFHDQPNINWRKDKIDAHFRGRIIDGKDIFDGALPLLVRSAILEIDITGAYHPGYKFKSRFYSIKHCKEKILLTILNTLKNDNGIYSVFSTEFCSYDFVNNIIQIDKSAFGLRFANIRDVLVNLDFLQPHPYYPEQSFAIGKSNKKIFDRFFANEIRKRQISPDQLQSILEQQQENGFKGEEFVYNFEVTRTERNSDDIEWIAKYDTAAGFDIMSYDSAQSEKHDRFIEVKAYTGNRPYFYWSKNEMMTANQKNNQYYIYLVNLDEISNPNYTPIMIQNPSINILHNTHEWQKIIDKYYISYIH